MWLGVEAGYFWSEHLKLEVGISGATEATSWTNDVPADANLQRLSYLSSEHAHSVRTLSAGVTYQFRRNAWVHPYLGAGVDIDRDRVRTNTWAQPAYDQRQGYQPPYQLPEVVTTETVGRLFAVGGVKVFFNERVFFRTDLKVAGRSRLDKIVARVMFGADF